MRINLQHMTNLSLFTTRGSAGLNALESAPAIRLIGQLALVFLMITSSAWPAEVRKTPIPQSPFLGVVYRYADAMLEHGRDVYGPVKTGLLLSALDRTTLGLLTNRPPAPTGIREGDRVGPAGGVLVGANPHHDENLLRLLYTLSGLSGQAKYRDAADAELKWFFENAASPVTGLLSWGEHMSWNVITDQPIPEQKAHIGNHEFFRPWVLADRSFLVAPEASRQFARAVWDHQIADHQTGAFNRHAGFWRQEATDGMDFARHAGFYIRAWAEAYAHTQDTTFIEAITVLLGRYEKKRHPATGLIEVRSGQSSASPPLSLSLAIDCDGAARRVPSPLAARLRVFARCEDKVFCALPHELEKRGGFVASLDLATGKTNRSYTSLWDAHYGGFTTAQLAMMCVARYENTGRIGYRELIIAAANAYLESLPDETADTWPMTLGHAISLQLAAWRATADAVYFDRARALGDWAIAHFWSDANPLPRASTQTHHYESITGADTLALALTDLHLHILYITAVRCPANTIDR